MSVSAFLWGNVTVKLEKRQRRICTSLLIGGQLPLVKTTVGEDGALYVTMRQKTYRAFCASVRSRGIPLPPVTAESGFPVLVKRFSYRPGILIGAVLAAALTVFSTLFCWRVDVVCLDNANASRPTDLVDTEAVREGLASVGVGIGTFLPTLDVRSAEKQFLIGQDAVSWIALNRRGSVLCAEVRSWRAVTDAHTQYLTNGGDGTLIGTNLQANADGIVRYWVLQNGNPVIEHEQMVTRGTLLATGFYESRDGDVIYRRAKGKVYAETQRILQESVPRSIAEKTATGKTETRYTLSFFGLKLPTFVRTNVTFLEIFRNFGKKTGFLPTEYDTIIDEHPLTLPDGTPLPLTWKKETRLYYTETERVRTDQEMQFLAENGLRTQRLGMTDAVVLSTETHTQQTEEQLVMTEVLHCIDNIAEEIPYYLKNNTQTED